MRALPLTLGVSLLLVLWGGPLPALAAHSFAAHMTMHVAVVAVAAPLLALALAGGRRDPVRRWPALFPALPAALLELLVVWGWHAPQAHQLARQSSLVMPLEQGSFLLVGLLTWLSAFGGSRAGPSWRERAGVGVLGLLLTSMHMTLLGALLTLAPRTLYPGHGGAQALTDQRLGGLLMLAVGGAVYLAGALALLLALLDNRQGGRGPLPGDAR